tara:strand:+ start:71 stop:1000 length:930 start_codon:yes stop_codon:yes gene_type:complete
MKNIFTTLLLLIIITISVNGQTRTVTKYYGNDDKQKVIHYQGSGDNEYVIKKNHYYTQNQGGGLQKVENYKDGKLHGTIKSWNSLGKITEEIKYKDGSPLTKVVYTYYDNKKLKEQSNWKYVGDWFTDGFIKYYRKNGVIEKEEVWSLGYKGESKLYYESGQIKEEIGGNVHKKWNENGQIIYHKDNNLTEEWYDNGVLKYQNDLHSHKQYNHEGELYNPEEYDLSELMTEMWDEGISKLDCTEYQYDLREVKKYAMQMSLSGILVSIVEDENYKTYFHNIDPRSKEWVDSFGKWWDKQRKLCKDIIED